MSAEKIVSCEFFQGEGSTCSQCSKPIQEHKGMILDSILISREQLDAAINAIHQTGHQPNCKFQGCTCGQVEDFIVARGTFIKLWQPFLKEQL